MEADFMRSAMAIWEVGGWTCSEIGAVEVR